MSYKTFYNIGNDNNYYDSCRFTTGQSLSEIYKCCRNQCKNFSQCKATCRNIYPGTIFGDCSLAAGCWYGGYYDPNCLNLRSDRIKNCCLNSCKAGKFSQNDAIQNMYDRGTLKSIDCQDYCGAEFNTLLNISKNE